MKKNHKRDCTQYADISDANFYLTYCLLKSKLHAYEKKFLFCKFILWSCIFVRKFKNFLDKTYINSRTELEVIRATNEMPNNSNVKNNATVRVHNYGLRTFPSVSQERMCQIWRNPEEKYLLKRLYIHQQLHFQFTRIKENRNIYNLFKK